MLGLGICGCELCVVWNFEILGIGNLGEGKGCSAYIKGVVVLCLGVKL
jgi:hypothetical protein